MNKDSISIIIPAYNGAPYLQRCIDSILRQNTENYEVIIIDDGSEDGFCEKCQAYVKDRKEFRLISQSNQGVSAARNLGMYLAEGAWIYFLDIDDELEPDALPLMLSYADPKLDWLIMNYNKQVAGTKKKTCRTLSGDIKGLQKGRDRFPQLLNEDLFMYPCAKLYSRQIIEKHGLAFPRGVRYGEDVRFNLEYFQYVDTYKVCQEPVMTYHIRQGEGAGSAYYENSFELQMDIDKKILEMDQKSYHLSSAARKELNHYFFRQGVNTAAAYLAVWKELSFSSRSRQIQKVLRDERFADFLEKERDCGRIKRVDYFLLKNSHFYTYYFIHFIYTKLKETFSRGK